MGEDCSAVEGKESSGVKRAWDNAALPQGKGGQDIPPKGHQQAPFTNVNPVQAGGDT